MWVDKKGREREREAVDETSDRDVALHRQAVLDTFSRTQFRGAPFFSAGLSFRIHETSLSMGAPGNGFCSRAIFFHFSLPKPVTLRPRPLLGAVVLRTCSRRAIVPSMENETRDVLAAYQNANVLLYIRLLCYVERFAALRFRK